MRLTNPRSVRFQHTPVGKIHYVNKNTFTRPHFVQWVPGKPLPTSISMALVQYDKVFLFGDSITEQSYEQTSGYNTDHAVNIIPRVVPPANENSCVRLVIIFFGANDAVLPGQKQHVGLAKFKENMRKIIQHQIWKQHQCKFMCISPPPICEYKTQDHDFSKGKHLVQRLADVTKTYADAVMETSRDLGVPAVNLWKCFITHAGGWEPSQFLPGSRQCPKNEKLGELLRDGLHLSPKGSVILPESSIATDVPGRYELLFNKVMRVIEDKYPHLDPGKMMMVDPHWEVAPNGE